jgi:hypothetical protein
MGDENSLAGTTKAHKHSALSSDGGFLETTVTGVTNLSEGSIVYGNASEIVTELTAGSDGDSLQISSGIPAWGSGGGAWVSEGNDVNTSRGDDLSVDVSDADVYQIQYNVSDVDGGTCSLCLRLNDVTTASSYDSLLGTAVDGGALNFEISSRAKWLLTNAGAELAYSGVCYIYKADANFISAAEAGATFTSTTGKNNSTTPYNANFCTGMNNTITGAISNIKLFCMKENTTANEGIIGSMRVNSLSYS